MKVKYAYVKAERIVIMPACNPRCGGVSVNVDGVLGPIGKMIDLPSSEIYLLNGTMLGKLGNLK
ncbi:MAG TPA: hypothetical protein ENG74_00565 [Thermoplasmatales archaeon]|nr:hypothetical protein [Thermoplasmatales archaeon]